jgi:transcription elongation factor Elf1
MLLIIFGTRVRTRVVDEGEFYCPSCRHERKYVRKQGRNYFALYFVPLVPMGEGNDIIECQHCHRSYKPEVLERRLSQPQPDAARLLNRVKSRLATGYPVEYMIRDLTFDGIDLDVARNLVRMAIGEGRAFCPECELTYAAEIEHCSECGTVLEREDA